uniref:Uncharacterized protein n=1 Tax=Glossina austeni TaxID=7395 RepID=A0A1A9UY72_GLOAU
MELNVDAAMNMSLDDYIAIKKNLKRCATTPLKSSVYGSNCGRPKNNIDNGEDDDDVIMLDDTPEQFVVPSTSNVSTDVWKGSGSAIKYLDCIDLTEDLRGKIKSNGTSGIQNHLEAPNTSSKRIYGMPILLPSRFGKSQIEQNYNSLPCNNRNNSKRSRRRRRNGRRIIKKIKNIRMKIDNRGNSNNGSLSRSKLFSNLTKRAVTDLWNNSNNNNRKLASQLLEFLQNSAESCTHKPCYDMKIQKDIHDIQKKPLQYYIPGGTLVTEDGVGVDNCKITPNCSGVSLNYRFA